MSVLWAGNMRGPRILTTVSKLVLLLLLLLSGPTRTVLCQDEYADPEAETLEGDAEADADATEEEPVAPGEEATDPPENGFDTTSVPPLTDVPDTAAPEDTTGEDETNEDEGLDLLLIIIPVVLVILIVVISVCGVFIYRRHTSKNRHSEVRKEDPYLEGSSTEKVPMPMFEEDVPSVLELEMDELDDWMKKDG